ncbi:STAS domain-containing protein [Streptomyces sp. NPDC091204]|uniref:STAS domain-containing protein n=1 Tax=Streptomyces sp. NPDC091204 TaxID=3155299 RepID=UPI0034418E44
MTVRTKADGVRVVVCSGEFDLDTIGLLIEACDAAPASAGLLVIDVRQLAFADSSFLNALIRLRNTRALVLQGPLPSQLRRMMEMTGALALFDIRDHRTHRLTPEGVGPESLAVAGAGAPHGTPIEQSGTPGRNELRAGQGESPTRAGRLRRTRGAGDGRADGRE